MRAARRARLGTDSKATAAAAPTDIETTPMGEALSPNLAASLRRGLVNLASLVVSVEEHRVVGGLALVVASGRVCDYRVVEHQP